MSRIVTYKNEGSKGKYCQIQLDDATRVFISVSQQGLKISEMKWRGLWPSSTILEIPIDQWMSIADNEDEARLVMEKVSAKSTSTDMLDLFKDVLIECHSLEQVRSQLSYIFDGRFLK